MTGEQDTAASRVDLGAYRAWLFDLDGVLTRTAEVHAAAWKQAFDGFLAEESRRTGQVYAPFDPEADYRRYVDGEPRDDGVRNFLRSRGIVLAEGGPDDPPGARTVTGLATRKNGLVQTELSLRGVSVYDGAVALVRLLRSRGVATAVVSASENTAAVLRAAHLADLFDVRVDGVTVKEHRLAGKPAPDSYLEAARMLDVGPDHAVVVEDALAGVEAGRSGRFGLVVGVDHHHRADELLAHGADVVVTDLAELLTS